MADIGISYSHRDTPMALALRQACIEAGLTVWMDDPGVDGSRTDEVGIPIGRAHWDVIEREFAASSVILALDSPEWRVSEYCQCENARCVGLGKWVVLVDPTNVSAQIALVKERLAANPGLFDAHAQIALRAVTGGSRRTLLQRWLPRSNSADTRVLVSRDLTASGLSITDALRGVLAEDVAAESSSRRRLRGAATIAAGALIVLAIGSTVGWLVAEQFSASALASQNRAEALALVEQSNSATDTLKAIADARGAKSLDPSDQASAALAKATLADNRLRAIDLPPDEYVGAAWASASPVVLAYSTARVVAVNTESGAVSAPIAVDARVYPGALVAGPDGGTAVYRNQKGQLTWVDLSTGAQRPLGVESITAIDISEDGLLWWATEQGSLSWAPYPAGDTLAEPTTMRLPATAKAVDAVAEQIAIVGDDAIVYLLQRHNDGLKIDTQTPINGLAYSDQTGGYRASISVCDGVVYGSYTPTVRGTSFRWSPADPNGATQTGITRSSAPVCVGNEAFSSDATRGEVTSFGVTRTLLLDPGANRYFAVGDPLHTRFAELSPTPSRLYVVDPNTAATTEELDAVVGHVVFDEREWLIGNDLRLVDAVTGELGGTLPGSPGELTEMAQYIQRIGCDALLLVSDHLVHVDCEGVVTSLDASTEGFRSIRAGADGNHFVVAFLDSVQLLHLDGSLDTSVGLPWSNKKEYVRDADISPDGSSLSAIDSFGVLRETPVSATTDWSVRPGTLTPGDSQLAYTADGNLLILSSDRLVRQFDPADKLIAIKAVPSSSSSTRLRVSGGVIVLSSRAGPGLVIDALTLATKEDLPTGMFDLQADGTLRGLAVFSSDGVTVTSVSAITIPAITQ